MGNEKITVTLIPFSSSVTTKTTRDISVATDVTALRSDIAALTAAGATHMSDAINTAKNKFVSLQSSDSSATNILVFLSDGEASNGYSITDTIMNNYNRDVNNNEQFAVGLGNDFSRSQLEKIVGSNHANDRVFAATNQAGLVKAFEDIASKINNIQTDLGYTHDVTITDVTKIYPVILSYTDFDGENKVTILCSTEEQLTANNVEIDHTEKTIEWDVSKYPGKDNFVITIGTGVEGTTALTSSAKSKLKAIMTNVSVANEVSNEEKLETKALSEEINSNDGSIEILPSEETTKSIKVEEVKAPVVVEETSKSNILSSIITKVENGDIDEEKVNSIADEQKVATDETTTADDATNKEEPAVEDKQEETKSAETKQEVKQEEKVEPVVEEKADEKSEETGKDSVESEVTEPTKVEEKLTVENTQNVVEENKTEEKVEISEPVIELTVEPTELVTVNTIAE